MMGTASGFVPICGTWIADTIIFAMIFTTTSGSLMIYTAKPSLIVEGG